MIDPKSSLIPAEVALQIVLANVEPIGKELVSLNASNGRTLSQDLPARRTQPPFDASAMDGYAVRQTDLETLPAQLTIIGESRAGVPFTGVVGKSQAVRIFTGAVVPDGADSIVIQENTTSNTDQVVINAGVERGKFVRKAGLDFTAGEVLLREGDQLNSQRLSLAASMNHANVPVYRQPKVALISTGDELVMPGEVTKPGQIIASNTFGLAAAIQNTGAWINDLGIIADTREALNLAFTKAIEDDADLIVTTGGASVGDHDLVLPVAEQLGFEFEIIKIAMRPGKPFLFGKIAMDQRTIRLTGLAGNPVSSLVAFNVFVKPLIQALGGRKIDRLKPRKAVLGSDVPQNDERAEYMRATLENGPNSELIATPFKKQDSSMLANLVRADCLLYRPVNAPAARAGEACEIVMIE